MDPGNEFHVLYIGQFHEWKAIDILLRALEANAALVWEAELVGDGPEIGKLRQLYAAPEIEGRMKILGTLDYEFAMARLDAADLLVLPSRYDGLGAVVNEALMLGVPAICTDRCGAADLIREPWLGSVVRAGSVSSLAEAVRMWIGHGKKTQAE